MRSFAVALLAVLWPSLQAGAASYSVNDFPSLATALNECNASATSSAAPATITLTADVALTAPLPPVFCHVVIDGQGHAIDGAHSFRIFFVGIDATTRNFIHNNYPTSPLGASVTMLLRDIRLAHGWAKGGPGAAGGGGGMGAGGALFINDSAVVTLQDVILLGNSAVGGTGGDTGGWVTIGGGGGGLGGTGGAGGGGVYGAAQFGGGGFFGSGGSDCGGGGGFTGDGGTGVMDGQAGSLNLYGIMSGGGDGQNGIAGSTPAIGGANGGGGAGCSFFQGGGGGGGGFGGLNATLNGGGSGGFGGGGGSGGGAGGFGGGGSVSAAGGFGGGGGAGAMGGFGGGGGARFQGGFGAGGGGGSWVQSSNSSTPPGAGGFGGGAGGLATDFFFQSVGQGGGGAGFGGAVFRTRIGGLVLRGNVMLADSLTQGGVGKNRGAVAGEGLYLAGQSSTPLVLAPEIGEIQLLEDSISDDVGVGIANTAGYVAGTTGLIKSGGGTAILAARNPYSGTTTINSGELRVTGSIGTTPTPWSTITVEAAGTLAGNGDVRTRVYNAGLVAPGTADDPYGALAVSGDISFSATGKLCAKLGTAGISNALLVAGSATLGGNVHLDFSGSPPVGSSYTIVQAGDISGTFAGYTTNIVNLQGDLQYSPAAVRFVVTASDSIFQNAFETVSLSTCAAP